MRSDGEGYNAEFRIMGGWAPVLREMESSGPFLVAVGTWWLLPVSGPWEFVEPAYMIRFSRPEVGSWGGSFGLGVLHWQIPGRVQFRPYIWDTRALLAEPAIDWRTQHGPAEVQVTGGPTLAVMGEGPGDGPSVGAHLRAGVSFGSRASVAGNVGWFWLRSTNQGDTRFTDSDVHGITLGVMIEF
jgi:hypothetical protein